MAQRLTGIPLWGQLINLLAAVLLQVLFCITLARLVTTSMAGLLRSRRGKDLAALQQAGFAVVNRYPGEAVHVVADHRGVQEEFCVRGITRDDWEHLIAMNAA